MLATDKDDEIVRLVDALSSECKDWVVVDHWDADRCAIGIAGKGNSRQLAYISCFKMRPGHFFVECERACGPEPTDVLIVSTIEDATYRDVVAILRNHLRDSTK